MAKQIDPVCGMELDPGQVEAQARYQGKAYAFCSEECMRLFEENPEAYSTTATPQQEEPPLPR